MSETHYVKLVDVSSYFIRREDAGDFDANDRPPFHEHLRVAAATPKTEEMSRRDCHATGRQEHMAKGSVRPRFATEGTLPGLSACQSCCSGMHEGQEVTPVSTRHFSASGGLGQLSTEHNYRVVAGDADEAREEEDMTGQLGQDTPATLKMASVVVSNVETPMVLSRRDTPAPLFLAQGYGVGKATVELRDPRILAKGYCRSGLADPGRRTETLANAGISSAFFGARSDLLPPNMGSGPGMNALYGTSQGLGRASVAMANLTNDDKDVLVRAASIHADIAGNSNFRPLASRDTRQVPSLWSQVIDAAQSSTTRSIQIQLAPVELGRVRITMNATESGVQVAILAERPETLELMRKFAVDFEKELMEIGYQNLDMTFSHQQSADNEALESLQKNEADPMPEIVLELDTATGTLQLPISAGMDIRV